MRFSARAYSRTRLTSGRQPGPDRRPPGRAGREALIAQLRQVNAEALAIGELSRGTIDTVLAKPDLKLGIEALMRGMQP